VGERAARLIATGSAAPLLTDQRVHRDTGPLTGGRAGRPSIPSRPEAPPPRGRRESLPHGKAKEDAPASSPLLGKGGGEARSFRQSWDGQVEELTRRWAAGESPATIAAALGRSASQVSSKAHGLRLPDRRAARRKPAPGPDDVAAFIAKNGVQRDFTTGDAAFDDCIAFLKRRGHEPMKRAGGQMWTMGPIKGAAALMKHARDKMGWLPPARAEAQAAGGGRAAAQAAGGGRAAAQAAGR
jgi:hypothetical protein